MNDLLEKKINQENKISERENDRKPPNKKRVNIYMSNEEREKLLYVELPNLINRILHLSMNHFLQIKSF